MDIHGKGYVFVDVKVDGRDALVSPPLSKKLKNISDETTIRYKEEVELVKDEKS